MKKKSETVEKAMSLINAIILDLNENSIDRKRLSSQSRLAVIKNINRLLGLDEEAFQCVVKQLFREELLTEMIRIKK